METRDIELTAIRVSDSNTRKDLDAGNEDGGIADLANSIQEQGLLSPVIVRRTPGGQYDLIAGQRRFLACRRIGWSTIPAMIRDDLDDADATVVSLVENVHRADMNPIDKAKAYQAIRAKYGDDRRVAKEAGVTVPTVRRYLSLLNLAPSIQRASTTSEGPAGVGTLSKLADTFAPEDQEKVLEALRGFRQSVQHEILKRSGGDLDMIPGLRAQAMEGVFDLQLCKENLCAVLPPEWKESLKEFLTADAPRSDIELRLPASPRPESQVLGLPSASVQITPERLSGSAGSAAGTDGPVDSRSKSGN